jgi:hypothetical protein
MAKIESFLQKSGYVESNEVWRKPKKLGRPPVTRGLRRQAWYDMPIDEQIYLATELYEKLMKNGGLITPEGFKIGDKLQFISIKEAKRTFDADINPPVIIREIMPPSLGVSNPFWKILIVKGNDLLGWHPSKSFRKI